MTTIETNTHAPRSDAVNFYATLAEWAALRAAEADSGAPMSGADAANFRYGELKMSFHFGDHAKEWETDVSVHADNVEVGRVKTLKLDDGTPFKVRKVAGERVTLFG